MSKAVLAARDLVRAQRLVEDVIFRPRLRTVQSDQAQHLSILVRYCCSHIFSRRLIVYIYS